MNKNQSNTLLGACLATLLCVVIGCGGSGGGSGGTTGLTTGNTTGTTTGKTTGTTTGNTTGNTTGSTTGSTTFTLNSSVKLNGGSLQVASVSAGTQTFNLVDLQGNVTSFNKVFVPLPLTSGQVTIVRAGSALLEGTFTSTTAECVNQLSGVQAAVPLNANGTLAEDLALDSNAYLELPIKADGALTFQGGVQWIANASTIGNNTKDVTLTLTTSPTTFPTGTNQNNITGTLSFSGGGTANTTASALFECLDASQVGALLCEGSSVAPGKTVAVSGSLKGPLPYTSAKVTYQIED